MRYVLNIKECEFLGSGHEGSVYLTPEGFALKVFYKKKNADAEVNILEKVKDSRFFPKVLFIAGNMVLREYVEGDNLHKFLKEHGLSYNLSCEIIDLIEDFKKLGFKRLNIRNAHIFVCKDNKIQIIDPREPYKKSTPYPKDIIKILVKLNLFDNFLKHLLSYKPHLLSYWISGYNYFINFSKKRRHAHKRIC
ncbi:serine/threonine protein kinase [Clostridium weizhouense]|uniref:Serine/threonine protein kinase n=1 Tax=Clostridium weizhouense TaxID=2859781 RepID=A0ABS7ALC4_9CLOT|nr:serine/threonine protein kinase [Clostridium weizhouense]MBW6409465.1 serine/threonine protein kinase [Clostridium weizhouense]